MADTLLTGTTLVEKESRSIGDVPIGGLVPWLSNLAGVPNLPVGWMLCDGSVVADATSPMNGATIPDLNGGEKFLRGNDTAGGTGGATTSSHHHGSGILWNGGTDFRIADNFTTIATEESSTNQIDTTVVGNVNNIPAIDGQDASTATIPPYHAVVWIIRIK